jgi:AAT family amino acid transporter
MTQHQRERQTTSAIEGERPSQLKRGLGARHIQMIALGGLSDRPVYGGGKKYCR